MKSHSQKLRNFFNKRKQNRPKRSSGKKRKFIASGALAAGLLFGRLKTNSDKIQNYQLTEALAHERLISNQKPVIVGDDAQSLIESQSVNSIRVKSGSGVVIEIKNQQNQKTSEALKLALETRCGDLGKSGLEHFRTISEHLSSSSQP